MFVLNKLSESESESESSPYFTLFIFLTISNYFGNYLA